MSGYQPVCTFDFHSTVGIGYWGFITCLHFLKRHNLLAVGGTYYLNKVEDGNFLSNVGVTLWRQLNADPYFSSVATVAESMASVSQNSISSLRFVSVVLGTVSVVILL